MRLFFRCAFLVLCTLTPAISFGSVIVVVGDLELTPGGDGFVDVTIRSTTGESLMGFFDGFVIDGFGLEFVAGIGQPEDVQLTSANYVFPLGLSFAALTPTNGLISQTVFENDSYFGADLTTDFSEVQLSPDPALLARLHVIAVEVNAGDVFTIALDAVYSTFYDGSFNTLDVVAYAGEIRIVAASTVPEPGTVWLLVIGAFGGAAMLLKRRDSFKTQFYNK